jgi:hypothetical protein
MPINREPPIYQGYVISQIGQSAGKEVTMDFKNAQNCVMSGTHRWADDETDMSLALQAEIKAREDALAAQVEKDRIHNLEMKRLAALQGAGTELPKPVDEVDIPADWATMHHQKKFVLARKLDPSAPAKMTKAEAEAIIEKWIADRDQVRETAAAEAGNRDERPILGKDGQPVSQEELDRQKAADFINLDEF